MKAIAGGKTRVSHMNTESHSAGLPGIKGPKDTSHGADLSGDATNCIGGYIHPTKAESQTSKSHSRNQ